MASQEIQSGMGSVGFPCIVFANITAVFYTRAAKPIIIVIGRAFGVS